VAYNIQGWLDKNKDPIQECVVQLMADAKEPLVSLFFKDPEDGNAESELMMVPLSLNRSNSTSSISNPTGFDPKFHKKFSYRRDICATLCIS